MRMDDTSHHVLCAYILQTNNDDEDLLSYGIQSTLSVLYM